ncbi:MAG TPA: transglycosylase domain-containing protein [Acidimicrobiales bacterium]|nr:transglycosylase domain-containing protein [Acidimicrobiales bacterium]
MAAELDLWSRRIGATGRLTRFLVVVGLVGVLTALSSALVAAVALGAADSPDVAPVSAIDLDPLSQRSVVLAADGSVLAVLHHDENRASIALEQVPQVVVDTVLAVEDRAFYEHGGMNLRATARALATNVSAGDVLQGGSTITQQLVKNALLTPKQDLQRKLQEAVLAIRLEDQMTKDEILERYLNTVYFGNGAYGVQAAAEMYFGIDAEDLDRTDAALLAGLIRSPVAYDPFTNQEVALERRDLVVDRLVTTGQIDGAEARRIKAAPVPTEPRNTELLPKPKDYFVEEVTQRLLADPRLGETRDDRFSAVFRGGLTIKTTLDPRLQALAEESVSSVIPEGEDRFTASVVSVEPGSGAVRALVGGRGFDTDKYNIATQGVGQQPGSSFKPFVLAAAVEEGISPRATIDGRGPCEFDNPGGIPDPYEVENFEGSAGGVLDLTGATRSSVNCAYVRLGKIVGLDKVVETAAELGITTELAPDLSLPLGSREVLPIDMAGAYATFANDGVHHRPYLVEEVLDADGDPLFSTDRRGTRAVSESTARQVTGVLEGVVRGGTATRARFSDGRPAAGKTGTTSEYSDAWFVGYVPQLSTAVWMGSPEGNVEMTNVGGIRVTGGSYPARIWQAFMGPAMEGQEILDFPPAPPSGSTELLRLPGERPPPARRSGSGASSPARPTAGGREIPSASTGEPSGGGEAGGGQPGEPASGEPQRPGVTVPRPAAPDSPRGNNPPGSGGGSPDPGGGGGGGGGGGPANCNPPGWPADNPPFPC